MKNITKHNYRDLNTQKRKNFVSTFSDNPQQFIVFNTTLENVLGGTAAISELKQSAKKVESLVLGWIDFCEDVGFYAFQTFLFEVVRQREPMINYIKNMSTDTKTKNFRDLKYLWIRCNKEINIPQAITICHNLQEEITEIFLAQEQSSTSCNIEPHISDLLEDDLDTDRRGEDQEEHKDDERFYKDLVNAVNKVYKFTSTGVPILKSSLGSGKERLKDHGNIPR